MTVPASAAGAGVEAMPPAGPGVPDDAAEPAVVLVDPPSPEELVEGAAATWRASLVEAAGGSTLVDVDELGDAVLDLSSAHPSGLAQLFAGRPTRLSSLIREGAAQAKARRRARAVAARATVYTQQYGIAPTSLAIGVATWVERTAPDVATDDVGALASATRAGTTTGGAHGSNGSSGTAGTAGANGATGVNGTASDRPGAPLTEPRVVHAPVLLRPVTLRSRGAAEADYELALESTIEVNPVLARALRSRGALLDAGAVARGTFTDTGFAPQGALARLASLGWAVLEDFQLTERVVVGTFVHPGQVLVDDLDALAGALGRHEVLAALAGVDLARDRLSRPLPKPVAGDRDPQTDRGLGDLDPAQQHLLDVVATGAHVFVDAPAGTDVTGTLAALVADAAAAGRTVLYVPGHRRAAVALADRLEGLGAGDLLLDIAPEAGWRSAASRRLLAAMTLEPPVVDDGGAEQLRRALVQHREALRGYVRGLHAPRQPWGVSAYDALQELARLTSTRPTPHTTVRLDAEVARLLDPAARAEAAADLLRAGELGAFSLRPSDTPWYGAELRTPAEAQTALARVDRLLATLPDVVARARAAAADTGLTPPASVAEEGAQLRLLDEVRQSLDVFLPLVFERTAADLVAATAPKAWRAQHGVEMGRMVRRRLRKQARDMVRPGRPVADLHTALLDVQRRRELWQQHCPGGGWPRLPGGLEVVEADYAAVRADIDALDEVLATTPDGAGLAMLPLDALVDRLTRLRAGAGALDTLPSRTALVRHLRGAGLGALVDDLAERRVPARLAAAELDLAWWSTVFELILAADPALAGYDGATLDAVSTRYAQLDRAHVAALAAPVRSAAVKAMGSVMRQQREQAEGLFSELIEERVTSIRDVMLRYPDVARRLRPVIVASPMLVPQVLPPSRTVDLVVLDAATRMPIEVVVSAIARGRQVVVVGDARCASGTAVRELAAVLPGLELHADASRRDPWLTAFLVAHGYGGALRPTPLPSAEPLVSLEVVDGTGLPGVESGLVDSTREEVDRVVELVVEHALTRPDESLAVVTTTARHADAVRDQVLGEARSNPSLAAFFDDGRADPFVVVDLPNVAGLRRDAVLMSLGLGRTPHRRVLHSFGPMSAPNGDAMLLDALGCAQHRLTVVSCFVATDLDPSRLRGPGARLLADLLAFAERRGRGDPDPLAPVERPAVDELGAPGDEPAAASDQAVDGAAGGAAATDAPVADAAVTDVAVASAADADAAATDASGTDASVTVATDAVVATDGARADDEAATGAAREATADEAGVRETSPDETGSDQARAHEAGPAGDRPVGGDLGRHGHRDLPEPGLVATEEPAAATDEPEAAAEPAHEPDPDRLVLDLAERLWRHGLTVEVDHGIPGGLRIPLVVGHPDVPDRFLVAVLTDDEAYVEEPSVRVRDRLVPERLERLGWTVLRVWSAAAFLDPQSEVDRIRRAVHAAIPERVTVPSSPRVAPVVDDEAVGWAASGAMPEVAGTGTSPTVPGAAAGAMTGAVPGVVSPRTTSAGAVSGVVPTAGSTPTGPSAAVGARASGPGEARTGSAPVRIPTGALRRVPVDAVPEVPMTGALDAIEYDVERPTGSGSGAGSSSRAGAVIAAGGPGLPGGPAVPGGDASQSHPEDGRPAGADRDGDKGHGTARKASRRGRGRGEPVGQVDDRDSGTEPRGSAKRGRGKASGPVGTTTSAAGSTSAGAEAPDVTADATGSENGGAGPAGPAGSGASATGERPTGHRGEHGTSAHGHGHGATSTPAAGVATGDEQAPGSAPVRVPSGVLRSVPKPRTGEVQAALPIPSRPRPDIRKGLPIGAYSDDQLDEMALWLMSDGQDRTRDELADALREELGLTRRTHRVDTAIRAAVTRAMA